jgi:Outer membrane protein beta-barrel domain
MNVNDGLCGKSGGTVNKYVNRLGMWSLVLLIVGVALPAAAQTPRIELGAGYQTSHIPENWNPVGFDVDVAISAMSDKWSVVGEVGLTRDSESAEGIADATLTDTNFGGGVRWSSRMAPVSGYFQLVAGGLRRKVDVNVIGIGIDDSSTKFMLQPSIGFTFDMMKNAGFKVDLGYRRVFLDEAVDGDSGENQFRLMAGINIGFPR